MMVLRRKADEGVEEYRQSKKVSNNGDKDIGVG